ncbi:helix-turn-helix transcriptional regulator [Burkholderia sp. JSH-S8]|nr:helix-turn-helix transcriptional regulator [Burkholderia sp. JSH-S8]
MSSTNTPSLHPGSALHISPALLGNVIRKTGTPDFVQAISDLVSESIEIDSVYLDRSRPDKRHPGAYVTDWFGSAASDYKLACEVAERYYEVYCAHDAARISCFRQFGMQVGLRDIAGIPRSRFREEMYDAPRTAHECALVHGTRTAYYFLGLSRTQGRPAFALADMAVLRQMGEFLAPLFELHASAGPARRTTTASVDGTAIEHFDRRIGSRDIRLSQREYQICRSLLSGRTVPETAHSLELRLSTAESYVHRAFAKLGIRTKWELLQWAHTPD